MRAQRETQEPCRWTRVPRGERLLDLRGIGANLDESDAYTREEAMEAEVGDRLVVKGHYAHEPLRDGEILEVGPEGNPPYLVRWEDGRVSLVFPGPDAYVDHLAHATGR